ncbi:MAG: peptidoglycan editing factor PgeF, partial [Pseudomonadota bacterium]
MIKPNWPAPPNVFALTTTREGGVSQGPYESLNLGLHVGDDPAAVAINRARLGVHLPEAPRWLDQVHGTEVVDAAQLTGTVQADAAFTREPGVVCAVMTADCLPILLCDQQGHVVAAAHAGWRGLHAGVIEATVAAMATPADRLLAWIGPAIGQAAFEVGEEVREAFLATHPDDAAHFAPHREGKWRADLAGLARARLLRLG